MKKMTLTMFQRWHSRDRPRFYDQVGHKTTDASIENTLGSLIQGEALIKG